MPAAKSLKTSDPETSRWCPMKTAPQTGMILLRAMWDGRPVVLVGRYVPAHGSWCTLPIYGQAEQVIFATGWHPTPELD